MLLRACSCGTPHPQGTRCPQRDKRRGHSAARGYNRPHRNQRTALLPTAYGQLCPLCGQPMHEHQALDLHHSDGDKTKPGDQVVHATCNRRLGAPGGGRASDATQGPDDPSPRFRETHTLVA